MTNYLKLTAKIQFTLLLLFIGLKVLAQTPDANNTLYVNINVNGGTGDGSSWANAIPQLADALLYAKQQNNYTSANPLKIFVAKGTYKPMYNFATANNTSARDHSFLMIKNVMVYGGFDPANYITTLNDNRILPPATGGSVLSGDIGVANDDTDNCYHVVVAANDVEIALLDGFTITQGNADGMGAVAIVDYTTSTVITFKQYVGAGMCIWNSSPALSNISINNNIAKYGGGLFNTGNVSSVYSNVTIKNNSASVFGGGICNTSDVAYINGSNQTVAANVNIGNFTLNNNSASIGGGMYNNDATISFSNAVINNNSATDGGGIYNDNSTIISISQSTLDSNLAFSGGGAIANDAAEVTLNNVNIQNNTSAADGGGMYNLNNSTITISNSDISNNTGVSGGGIYNFNNPTITISNTDISDNTGVSGGGIYNHNSNNINISQSTLSSNSAISGGGMYNMNSNPVLTNVIISNNSGGSYGGGIYNNNSTPTFNNSMITENQSLVAGAIYNVGGGATLNETVISFNAADATGAIFLSETSNLSLNSVRIVGNSGGSSGGIVGSGTTTIIGKNVEITGNTTVTCTTCTIKGTAIALTDPSSTINLVNATISNNSDVSYTFAIQTAGSLQLTNSIVFGKVFANSQNVQYSLVEGSNSTANGNISASGITPTNVFINPTGGDFNLSLCGLLVDNGNNSLFAGLGATTQDISGNPRVVNNIIDIGAYEQQQSIISPDVNGIIYVKQVCSGAGLGNSWDNATSNLQQAINTTGVQKVFVATGTYSVDDNSFIMKNGVEIYGGFNPSAGIISLSDQRIMPDASNNLLGTILNGAQTRPVIWNYNNGLNATAVLDGFTITGGTGASGAGIYNRNASPTLRNLVIRNNTATVSGGGMYNWGASPAIINTVFKSNVVTGASGSTVSGGAIFNGNASAPVLSNVNIVSNLVLSSGTENGAGMYNENSSPKIYNSIFYKNIEQWSGATVGADIQNTGNSTPILKNSITQTYSTGNTSDNNLIGANPLFTDVNNGNYTLQVGSPAIDAGDSNYIPSGVTLDLAGNSRLFGNNADMGVYESQFNIPAPIKLVSFTAQKQSNKSYLQWTTASEQNNKGFNIERSKDGKIWGKIGFVFSKAKGGNSFNTIHYNFMDWEPTMGNNFYRLKQLNFDGSFEYSPVRVLYIDFPIQVKIYPNPANDQVQINDLPHDGSIVIFDQSGKKVLEKNHVSPQETISVKGLMGGTYLIQIIENNSIILEKKLVIIH